MSARAHTAGPCLAVALIATVAAFATSAAFGGGGNDPKVRLAKHADGRFQPTPQRLNLDASERRSAYVRLSSTGKQARDVTFTEDAYNPAGYQLRWFKGDADISHDVQTAGFDFKLKPGRSKTFRLRITADPTPDPACLGARFDVSGIVMDRFGHFAINDSPDTICSG